MRIPNLYKLQYNKLDKKQLILTNKSTKMPNEIWINNGTINSKENDMYNL